MSETRIQQNGATPRSSPRIKRSGIDIDALQAFAGLMRDIRNYGVHPRDDIPKKGLEKFLTEEGSALLLMEAHSFFVAVDQATSLATP